MKVFVTGGNGFIGSRVVHFLIQEGHTVRCLLRETSKTHRIDAYDFERHLGDIRDVDSLTEGMRDCDAVIHLASISAWDQIRSPLMRTIVIDGTRNVLNAAQKAGNLRVIFVSTMVAVNGTKCPEILTESSPFSLPAEPFVYGNAKREAEEMCLSFFEEHQLPVLIVNPCEVWGPNDDDFITAEYARDTIKDWPAMTVKGGTALAHVDDIAMGITASVTKGRPGERYILGGENVHASEITAMILEAAELNKLTLHLPNGITLALINTMSKLGLPTPIHPDLLAHAVRYWFADCSKAEQELGYSYRPARETIGEVVHWLREAGHV